MNQNPIERDRNTAFIIGNGKSRDGFDLEKLRPYGKIYGCNALYRDFEPDFLVAIDDGMIDEIKQSDFPKEKFIEPPLVERFEPAKLHGRTHGLPRSNAGMNAMMEAIRRDHDQLILIGFDFIVASEEIGTSNIYTDTVNYGPETKATFADNANRMWFLNWFIDNNSDVKFIFTIPMIEGSVSIWEFATENDVYGVELEQLMNLLKE